MKRRSSQKTASKPNPFLENYEIPTHEEEQIQEIQESNRRKYDFSRKKGEMINEDENDFNDDDEESLDVDLNTIDLKSLSQVDKLNEIIHRLLLKKKITSVNAFDIPMPNIREMSDFTQYSSKFENWKKLSTALESEAQIYGHRVDFVYMRTNNVIGDLFRTGLDQLQNPEQNIEDLDKMPIQLVLMSRQSQNEDKHLEKKPENITATKYDIEFDVDPLFKKTSEKFDAAEAKALLLNNLTVDEDLKIEFSSFQQKNENKQTSWRGLGYKGLNDLGVEWEISAKTLRKIPIGDNMDRIVKEMALTLENIENFEPKKEANSSESESLGGEPFDPYFMIDHGEELEWPAMMVKEEKLKESTAWEEVRTRSTKKKAIEWDNEDNEENLERNRQELDPQNNLLEWEGIEEKNKKIGKGTEVIEKVIQKVEPVVQLMEKEQSGNSKRRRKEKPLFAAIDFDMYENEEKFRNAIFKTDREKRCSRKKQYFFEDDFPRDLFLMPKEVEFKLENLRQTFLRNLSSSNEINTENNRDKEERKSESENELNDQFDNKKLETNDHQNNEIEEEEEKERPQEEQEYRNNYDENNLDQDGRKIKTEDFSGRKILLKGEEDEDLMEIYINKESRGKPVKIKALAMHSHISMKQLKEKMLGVITQHFQERKSKPLRFSTVLEVVRLTLSKIQKSLVNMQLCFLSLLHISNENNLILKPCPGYPDDFLIAQDSDPNAPLYK